MGAKAAWLQVRCAEQAHVKAALIEELGRRGARLIGEGHAATRKAAFAVALDRNGAGWTTVVPSDDAIDFELAIRLSEAMRTVVLCSEVVDAELYRAEGLVGDGAADLGRRMEDDYREWPESLLAERSFRSLGAEERSLEFLAFTRPTNAPATRLDWSRVFGSVRADRYCMTMSIEGLDASVRGRVVGRAETARMELEMIDALQVHLDEERVAEESTARLRSTLTEFDLALEGCAHSTWLGTAASCSLHYGVREDDPAHWVYVTEGAPHELVFRVDARAARPDAREWMRVQESVVHALESETRRNVRGCHVLDRGSLAFFVEPDLVVGGALEVLFVGVHEARALASEDARRKRAHELRNGAGFALNPPAPSSLAPARFK